MRLSEQDVITMIRGARLLCARTLAWRNSMQGPSLEWQSASEDNEEAQRVLTLLYSLQQEIQEESQRRRAQIDADFPGHSQR